DERESGVEAVWRGCAGHWSVCARGAAGFMEWDRDIAGVGDTARQDELFRLNGAGAAAVDYSHECVACGASGGEAGGWDAAGGGPPRFQGGGESGGRGGG